jgi:hypothetical protein
MINVTATGKGVAYWRPKCQAIPKNVVSTLSIACDLPKPRQPPKQENSSPTWRGHGFRLADDLERTLVILDVEDDETEPERRTG